METGVPARLQGRRARKPDFPAISPEQASIWNPPWLSSPESTRAQSGETRTTQAMKPIPSAWRAHAPGSGGTLRATNREESGPESQPPQALSKSRGSPLGRGAAMAHSFLMQSAQPPIAQSRRFSSQRGDRFLQPYFANSCFLTIRKSIITACLRPATRMPRRPRGTRSWKR